MAAVLLLLAAPASAQETALYVSRPGQILKLADLNADGDYFDFAEKAVYAEGLPNSIGAISAIGSALYFVDGPSASIYVATDLNGDGDALDFSEVRLYAQLPGATLVGLAGDSEGAILTIDSASGTLYRIVDVNGDGDAFDANEIVAVASGLTSPIAIAFRPDGRLLVAVQNAAIPVRILRDYTADGDYLDFAENISYAESVPAGSDLVVASNQLAFLARPGEGRIMALTDLTQDDDVLDFAEIVPFAENLPSPARLALDGAGGLFVACQDANGTIYRLQDLNADGDCLDFAESLPVADGLTQIAGMIFLAPPPAACLKGDIDGNSAVTTADIAPLVQILLGIVVPTDPCPADTNNDGLLDARDIAPFIALLF
jgi:hypothetical protein